MSDKPEQTAFFAIIPTEDAPHLAELLRAGMVPEEAIRTYTLPTSQQEAERLAARLLGHPVHALASTHIVTPHESRPTSFITDVVTDETVEAITRENFQAVSNDLYGNPRIGSRLANQLFNSSDARRRDFLEQYLITYRLKLTIHKALKAGMAGQLLEEYDRGKTEPNINQKGHLLLAHVCELIEDTPDTPA